MQMIIYKELGKYRCTTEENFRAFMQDERKINKLDDFESAAEIIEYYCKWFGNKTEDFTVAEERIEAK